MRAASEKRESVKETKQTGAGAATERADGGARGKCKSMCVILIAFLGGEKRRVIAGWTTELPNACAG